MKRSIRSLFNIAICSLMISACSDKKDSKAVAENQNDVKFQKIDLQKDAEFAVNVADDGMLEVQLGKLAIDHGFLREVQELGQMMIDDHGKANNELKSMADKKNISLPAGLSEQNNKIYEKFIKKSNSDFDKDYVKLMISAHKKAIDAFKEEATNGVDVDLKDWASDLVPALEHHLAISESAEKAAQEAKIK